MGNAPDKSALFTVFNIETFGKFQRLNFIQREIYRVVTTVFARPIRETIGNISNTIEVMVMQNNQIVVFGHHQILFQIIRSLRIRHRFCWQRMLRQISTGTAMGDDYFSLLSAAIALLPMTIVLIMIAMLRFFSVNFMPLASVAFLQ